MLRNHFQQAIVPPLRERLGDPNRLAIPLTYPGKRKHHIPRPRMEGGRVEDLHGQAYWEMHAELRLIILRNQSPRVPARFPKATTTRRKIGERREQIESRKEQSGGGRGVPAHNRKSAIFLRPRKADIIACCIYHAPQSHTKRFQDNCLLRSLSAERSIGPGSGAAMFPRADMGEFSCRASSNTRLGIDTP